MAQRVKALLANLMTCVRFSGPIWWKGKTHSCTLPSSLCSGTHTLDIYRCHTHTHASSCTKYLTLKRNHQALVAHAFNSSTQKRQAGDSLSSRPAWSVECSLLARATWLVGQVVLSSWLSAVFSTPSTLVWVHLNFTTERYRTPFSVLAHLILAFCHLYYSFHQSVCPSTMYLFPQHCLLGGCKLTIPLLVNASEYSS